MLEDKDAFAELAALGIRSVPIVRRGGDWANGQVLREVARVAGVAWGGAEVLSASELAARLIEIQTVAQRLFAQIPDDELAHMLPHRPRRMLTSVEEVLLTSRTIIGSHQVDRRAARRRQLIQ